MYKNINRDKIDDYLREVADEVILPRFKKLNKDDINTKTSSNDLVTIADIEAEKKLGTLLQVDYPGSYVVGEESVSRNEIDISVLFENDAISWVIDPIDGTHNFVHGDHKFGIMLACVQNGITTHGWIYDILGQRMVVAEKGSGTEINQEPLIIPQSKLPLNQKRCFISRKFLPDKLKSLFEEKFNQIGEYQPFFCCAHEYVDIALGKAEFAIYSRIKPWDHLPGSLIVEESGGYVKKWDASLYKPGEERGGLIVSSQSDLWQEVYEIFIKDII